ncbi:glycosyltransferase family 39 protein [Candidatus Poribacteria bacterium]|nr:glycosyltransferase family 39 protein [Candidatus Poribacteria bacterium]
MSSRRRKRTRPAASAPAVAPAVSEAPPPSRPHWQLLAGIPLVILILAESAVALVYLLSSFEKLTCPFALENGEGILVRFISWAGEGKSLYLPLGDKPPWLGCNYPPVFICVSALLSRFLGVSLLAPRLVSFVSTLAFAPICYGICRRLGVDRAHSAFGGLLCFFVPIVNEFTLLARVDMMATCLSLLGILLVMPRHGSDAADQISVSEVAGMIVLALASFTKQTGIWSSVAYGIWVLAARRNRLPRMLAMLGGTGVVLHVGATVATGGDYFRWVVSYSSGQYDWNRFVVYWWEFWKRSWFLVLAIAAAAPGWWWFRRALTSAARGAHSLFVAYALVVLASCMLVARTGSSLHYFLELYPVLCCLAAAGLFAATAGLPAGLLRGLPALVMTALLASHVVVAKGAPLRVVDLHLKGPAPREMYITEIARAFTGPSIFEDPGFGVLAGHEPYFDNSFIYADLARRGMWSDAPVVADLESGRVTLVCLNSPAGQPNGLTIERYTPGILKAVAENYPHVLPVGEVMCYFRTAEDRGRAYQIAKRLQEGGSQE